MFRLSGLLRNASRNGAGIAAKRELSASPIVIWNLTKACNLACVHCYASANSGKLPQELSTEQALLVLDGLKAAGVSIVVLSGGEPMLRRDLELLARRASDLGISVTLSTNGTMLNETGADQVQASGFDYIGVSLDGARETHDRFRGLPGAYDKSIEGLLRLKERGLKVGVRFTLTKINIGDLHHIFDLVERYEIEKLYLSHLVYSGRGDINKSEDISPANMRSVMRSVFEKAEEYRQSGSPTQIVTGNNDADGVFLLLWMLERNAGGVRKLLSSLERAGGNSAGIGVANIDAQGCVHPDPLIQSVTLGNVKEKAFGEIWNNSNDPVLQALRARPRKINGRCGGCVWIKVCGGNNRARAHRMTGDFWGSDPACYLTEDEISVEMACAV